MAVDVEIPEMGESVTEAVLIEWLKDEGEYVERDEPICVLETDKANVDLPAPAAGVLQRLKEVDAELEVGDVIARLAAGEAAAGAAGGEDETAAADEPAEGAPEEAGEESGGAAEVTSAVPEEPEKASADDALSPAVRRLVAEHGLDPASITGAGKEGRLTKEDVLAYVKAREQEDAKKAEQPAAASKTEPRKAVEATPAPAPKAPASRPAPTPKLAPRPPQPAKSAHSPAPRSAAAPKGENQGIRREPMSRIRQRIAQHLVSAQQNAAMLTTFNEVDMSGVMALRAQYKERFTEIHGVSLGLMSFFSRAVAMALGEFEVVNAWITGDEVEYHDYVNLGIAVGTQRGLVVPVLKNVEQMSMARIESEIKRLALGARDNRLSMDDLIGGTFTITNGGIFGSLLSTPILNAPQSGILGMHAIQQRPVAVDGKVEIRPMMYVALSYDHRLVDGQQSVSCLVRIKQLVEDPARLLLEV